MATRRTNVVPSQSSPARNDDLPTPQPIRGTNLVSVTSQPGLEPESLLPPLPEIGVISGKLASVPFFYWGMLFICVGQVLYFLSICLSILRLLTFHIEHLVPTIRILLWISGFPTTIGLLLAASDLVLMLPLKRRLGRRVPPSLSPQASCTVALTAYNDEASIYAAVKDFVPHPRVRRVIVVSNNSTDGTMERATQAGAIVYNEPSQGYGACVYRCLRESLRYDDTELIVLCEGDLTFRAADLEKFLAYIPHAEIVNGTRIVEQLRSYHTQLSTFMYYGNFFVGKLLELKHLGKGTFTDVGTTYKMMRREALARLLPKLNPAVNLEFNAHFLDTSLENGFTIVECPITFFPRVGESKGGNADNLRALKVGVRMMLGLSFGWGRGR
jgi:Glycosyl transferase family 2